MLKLHQSCLNNLFHYWRLIADTTQGVAYHDGNAFFTLSGIQAGIFNAIFDPDFSQKNYQSVKENLKYPIKTPTYSISFWVNPKTKEGQFLNERKLASFGLVKIMLGNIDDLTFPHPHLSGVEIIRYNEKNLTEWMHPMRVSFGQTEEIAREHQKALEAMSQHLVNFAALYQNQIIGIASIFTADQMPGFYNLAVLPEYRKQGIATALHQARTAYLKGKHKHITLQATPAGASLYESLGFKSLSAFDVYLDEIIKESHSPCPPR